MHCHRCGAENADDRRYCRDCGASLTGACPACGFENEPEARFCGGCGVALDAAGAAGAGALRPRLPRHLAERILSSRAALVGERKQVTILFADIAGSTAMIEALDPEQAAKRLEPTLRLMMEAVHRFEGTVNRVHGDGIMALFGAPLALEDHAAAACFAALAMQEAVKAASDLDTRIRIGLHSGEVVVRSIDNDLSMDYDAIGAAVHVANRMEQLAAPGGIRLTGKTRQMAEGFIRTRQLGMAPVKGISEPIPVFELTGRTTVRTSWEVRAARGLTTFVGREADMNRLIAAVERASGGFGQIAAIMGEPGIGKSRLVHEFVSRHRPQGWAVFEAGGVRHGKHTPYLPASNLLRSWAEIGDRDSHADISRKIGERLAGVDEGMLAALPAFQTLLDVPVADRRWRDLDPAQKRRRIIEAVKTLILRSTEIVPLLLVIEDLHWMDAETLTIVNDLVTDLGRHRILVLATYRPEFTHDWGGQANCTLVQAQPLVADTAGRLLDAVLGADAGLDRLKRLLIARSEGTPLFLEESVRTLVETGVLAGAPGGYRLNQPLDEIDIPDSVQAVLAARIDRLPPEHKNLLQSASVIGKDVPVDLLQEIEGLPAEELRQRLAELQTSEFLYETRLLPDQEFTFKHALTHEVAYDSVLLEQRRNLHAQAVAIIEANQPARLEEQVDRLADHAFRGQLWEKAARYHLQACARAIGRSAIRETIALFERGLEAVSRLPDGPATAKLAIDLRLVAAGAFIPLGAQERMVAELHAAERLAAAADDERRLGSVSSQLCVALWMMGDHDRALAAGERAVGIAAATDNYPQQLAARFSVGMVRHAFGAFRQSIDIHLTLLDEVSGELQYKRFGWAAYPSVFIQTFLASALIEIGEFERARAHVDDGCRLADEVAHPYSQVTIHDFKGHLLLAMGEVEAAVEVLETCHARCREEDILTLMPSVLSRLGTAYARSGRVDEAVVVLERAADPKLYSRGGRYTWTWVFQALAEAYLRAGRLDEARDWGRRSHDLTAETGERAHHAGSLKLLGDIHRKAGGAAHAEAARAYGDAIALAESCEMRPLMARCHFSLGKLHDADGRAAAAAAEFATAADLFARMGLTRLLRAVEAYRDGAPRV